MLEVLEVVFGLLIDIITLIVGMVVLLFSARL